MGINGMKKQNVRKEQMEFVWMRGEVEGDAVVRHVKEEIELWKHLCKWAEAWVIQCTIVVGNAAGCCRMSAQSSSHLSHPGWGISSPSLCSLGGWHELLRAQPELLPASPALGFWPWPFWNMASTFSRNRGGQESKFWDEYLPKWR